MEKDVPIYKIKDFSGFNSIYLVFDFNCNMHCRHCFQNSSFYDLKRVNYNLSIKLQDFIDNFIQYHVENNVGVNLEEDVKPKISFWGGEPLLHWDFIKSFILSIYEKYGDLRKHGLIYEIVSNGLLLTQDKVDFINKYCISFNFSYDAPYPWAVRDYVSDEICNLVNQIKYSTVLCSCFNKYNCDPLLAYRCLKSKFPNVFSISISDRILKTFEFSNDIMDYDWNKIRENYRKLRIASQLGDKFALHMYEKHFKCLVQHSLQPVSSRVLRCMYRTSGLAVTVDGRCRICGNFKNFDFTLDNTLAEVSSGAIHFAKSMESPECNICRHGDICRKHCLLDSKNPDGSFVTCKTFWLPLYDIIKSQISFLSKPLSSSDLEWYLEQEKIMGQQIQNFLHEGQRFLIEHKQLPFV